MGCTQSARCGSGTVCEVKPSPAMIAATRRRGGVASHVGRAHEWGELDDVPVKRGMAGGGGGQPKSTTTVASVDRSSVDLVSERQSLVSSPTHGGSPRSSVAGSVADVGAIDVSPVRPSAARRRIVPSHGKGPGSLGSVQEMVLPSPRIGSGARSSFKRPRAGHSSAAEAEVEAQAAPVTSAQPPHVATAAPVTPPRPAFAAASPVAKALASHHTLTCDTTPPAVVTAASVFDDDTALRRSLSVGSRDNTSRPSSTKSGPSAAAALRTGNSSKPAADPLSRTAPSRGWIESTLWAVSEDSAPRYSPPKKSSFSSRGLRTSSLRSMRSARSMRDSPRSGAGAGAGASALSHFNLGATRVTSPQSQSGASSGRSPPSFTSPLRRARGWARRLGMSARKSFRKSGSSGSSGSAASGRKVEETSPSHVVSRMGSGNRVVIVQLSPTKPARSPSSVSSHRSGGSDRRSDASTVSVVTEEGESSLSGEYDSFHASNAMMSHALHDDERAAAAEWESHYTPYRPWDSPTRTRRSAHHMDLFPEHLAPHSQFEWFGH